MRLQGAVSDLHAAEACYHDSCRKNFMLFKINPQVLIRHLISLWKTSLVISQRLGPSVMSMKAIYCMVVKDAAKKSLQNCRSTSMTN